jgi:hypothetical protein
MPSLYPASLLHTGTRPAGKGATDGKARAKTGAGSNGWGEHIQEREGGGRNKGDDEDLFGAQLLGRNQGHRDGDHSTFKDVLDDPNGDFFSIDRE